MKVAFPVSSCSGLESEIFNHFGSAEKFIIVDTDTGSYEEVFNNDLGHSHNQCNPLKAIGEKTINAVVSGGIGQGALNKLRIQGVKVYRTDGGKISDNLELFARNSLEEFLPGFVCTGHGSDDGCTHH